ncbi:MAG: hypothetical protein CR971_02350 [candidate division SR1 bacterium]|nr:MAG: hypothetical protein CR971_02350 [candidate division SR1 bacterium]
MYFAIISDKKELTLKEIKSILPNITAIKQLNENLITFDTSDEIEKLMDSGSVIKWGRVIPYQHFTTLINTDREVREKGRELIKIGNFYGLVEGYQNIPLYEKIDFEKPARSMQMGMMPAKLTHIMLNIGLSFLNPPYEGGHPSKAREGGIIYDPFAGSGTTCFLANYFGYESIGSDIKTQYFAENIDWWKKQADFIADKRIQIFNHDITQNYTNEGKAFFSDKTPIIITEGRLGPIVNSTTTTKSIQKYQKQVEELYTTFLIKIQQDFGTIPMVFTIPYYLKTNSNTSNNTTTEISNTLDKTLENLSTELGRNYDEISEVYARANQQVGRKIIILN